jgi:hypothetical protein
LDYEGVGNQRVASPDVMITAMNYDWALRGLSVIDGQQESLSPVEHAKEMQAFRPKQRTK